MKLKKLKSLLRTIYFAFCGNEFITCPKCAEPIKIKKEIISLQIENPSGKCFWGYRCICGFIVYEDVIHWLRPVK